MDLSFYVTKLDPPATAVLGLNWLTAYNPLVDWSARTISFPTAAPSPARRTEESLPPTSNPSAPVESSDSPSAPPLITLVGAAAFVTASRLPGSQVFHFQLRAVSSDITLVSAPPDLSSIPKEYHDFADVFSEDQAFTLPPHRPYDLKIDLEDNKPLPPGRLYSLSPAELEALRLYRQKHLRWIYSAVRLSPWCSCPLCQEEGRFPPSLCRLPSLESHHQKGPLPSFPHLRSPSRSGFRPDLLKDRSPACVPFSACGRRR